MSVRGFSDPTVPVRYRQFNFPTYGTIECRYCGKTVEKTNKNQIKCTGAECELALRREQYARDRDRKRRKAK